eukprot:4792043-Pyramimonas_sp.AAC.1
MSVTEPTRSVSGTCIAWRSASTNSSTTTTKVRRAHNKSPPGPVTSYCVHYERSKEPQIFLLLNLAIEHPDRRGVTPLGACHVPGVPEVLYRCA